MMVSHTEEFRAAIASVGLTPPDVIEAGRFHRFPGVGKKNGNKAGWCKFFLDGMGGAFGDYATDLSENWQAKKESPRTKEEQEAFRRAVGEARKQAEQERQAAQDEAAKKAVVILAEATGDPTQHPYAINKRVPLGKLVKRGPWPQRGWDDALLIPLYDQDGAITSISAINANLADKKDLLSGGKVKGCFHPLGKIRGAAKVITGEGFATIGGCHAATGSPCVMAVSASNLKAVSEVIRQIAAPGAELIIVADDDRATEGNPGKSAAIAAAKAVGGKVAIPSLGKKADAWDVWNEQGPDALRKMIEAAISPDSNAAPSSLSPSVADWPEPLPLVVHQQAAPYPLDALPGIIGAAVREVVDFVQCPVALGACSALAVISTVGQGLVDVRRAGKLEGPTSIFPLAIADSGDRKTTVDGFFSKPVQEWEAEQAEAAKPDIKRYEAAIAAWDAERSGLLAAIKEAFKTGKSTDELKKRLAVLEFEKPKPPKVPRLLFGDSTPEAMAHRLAFEWPVGGVLSSEAGIVFGGHAMSKDSAMRNMAMLNSLWGAEPLTVDRRSQDSFTVRGARLTMGLAVQSETMRAFLDSSKGLARGIGWLARFLIAWPESTQGGRMFKDPPETWPNLAKFHRRLGALLDQPLTFNDRGELDPELLELSPEAKAEWVTFHDEVEAELRPGRDMAEVKDVASKAADNAARLAALFHLFENEPGGSIGINHMRAAASLTSWHLYEARRFMGEIALPDELNNAAKVEAWLLGYCQQKREAEVTTSVIQQLGPNCTRKKCALDPALEELAEVGRVRIIENGRRKLVQVNPLLLRYDHGTA